MGLLYINNHPVDTAIFDFDGTLALMNIDFGLMRSCILNLIASYGIDPASFGQSFVLELIDEAERIIGQSSRMLEEEFRNEAYRLIEEIEVEAAGRGRLFEKTKYLLDALKEESIGVGIITRNCRKALFTVFPDITSYCRVVITREDVRKVKPHPEQIKLAIQRLGAEVRQTIMIGDHPLDIETGRRGSTLTAGVLTGNFKKQDFTKARADIVLAQAADLLEYLSPGPSPD